MNIGVAGPFNPITVKQYFENDIELPDINHMATSVNAYVNGLLKLGHRVIVFTTYSFKGQPYILKGKNISICFISTQFKLHALGKLRMVRRIRDCIRDYVNELDVLHAEWTYEYALAIKAFKNCLPLFCSVRDWAPYIFSLAKKANEKYYWGLSLFIFWQVMKGDSLHFIANSDYTKKQILSKYPSKKVATIPNPMNSKNVLISRTDYPKEPTFISISTRPFSYRKNNLVLLDAFSAYRKKEPSARLIIVGSYSEEEADSLEKKGLLVGVQLTGLVSHDEVISLIDRSSCLVHPALEETFGNILLEGMCRRVPCIGGEHSGAVPQVLGYGKYGFLCDVTSSDSIAEAMEQAMSTDQREIIINACTEYITKTFSDTVIAQSHIDLFSKCKED